MATAVDLERLLPVYGIEQGCILSRRGDITLAFELTLPEIFTLSNQDYEALHQTLVKAIRLLPRHSVFHKQDWFVERAYQADFSNPKQSFLSQASERFFQGRTFLEHHCYVLLTKLPEDVKPSSSLLSGLLRHSLAPQQTLRPQVYQDFLDKAGQLVRVLEDSGLVSLRRLSDAELTGTPEKVGLLERYCGLLPADSAPCCRTFTCGTASASGTSTASSSPWPMRLTCRPCAAPGSGTTATPRTNPPAAPVLPPRWDSSWPVTTCSTSIYLSVMPPRPLSTWKASVCGCSPLPPTRAATPRPVRPPRLFSRKPWASSACR